MGKSDGIARFTVKLVSFPEDRKALVVAAWKHEFHADSLCTIKQGLEQLPHLLIENGNAEKKESVLAAFEKAGATCEVTEEFGHTRLHLLDSAAKLLRVAVSSLGERGQHPEFGPADLEDVGEIINSAEDRIKTWTHEVTDEDSYEAFTALDMLAFARVAIAGKMDRTASGWPTRSALTCAIESLKRAVEDNQPSEDSGDGDQPEPDVKEAA